MFEVFNTMPDVVFNVLLIFSFVSLVVGLSFVAIKLIEWDRG